MNWKPNKFIAVSLSLVFPPLGMLYINKPIWAFIYLMFTLGMGFLSMSGGGMAPYVLIPVIVAVVHIIYMLKDDRGISFRSWYTKWYGIIGILSVFLAAILFVRSFLYEPFRIPSGSMYPTIERGSYLIVKKWGYGNYGTYGIELLNTNPSTPLHRGDIIAFKYPRKPSAIYAKRIIGIPGDSISYNEGELSINGKKVNRKVKSGSESKYIYIENIDGQSYSINLKRNKNLVNGDVIVPEGNLFVMGDNRFMSNDSRYWGFVPFDHIIGRVVYVFK